MRALEDFNRVWLVDFEFLAPPGDRQVPVCMVAREWKTGEEIREWLHGRSRPWPLISSGAQDLFVAYFASAEIGCYLALGWPKPAHILDLFAEFRRATNGRPPRAGNGLLGALQHYGLPGLPNEDKDAMRGLVLKGPPWDSRERGTILEYCAGDVEALGRLLTTMAPRIDLPRALLRGRYMAAVASMEFNGIPLDVDRLELLREHWEELKVALVEEVDRDYEVYEGTTFKQDRFKAYLAREGIPWPVLESGPLDLTDDTFKDQARLYPRLQNLRELRHMLGKLRLNSIPVGQDGRTRVLLSPFGARSGRHTPSNSRYIFGPATWLRSLIKPGPGKALAYIDWSQQEFGIAAALSGDPTMLEAAESGDPYLTFAIQAGAAPPGATRESHGAVRDAYKAVCLGVLYGMGEASLARKLEVNLAEARILLDAHRVTYRVFWRWAEAVQDYAMTRGYLWTRFGWGMWTGDDPNPRTLRNFPMQANGAEMLRLAISGMVDAGIKVLAPVHDAVLVESDAGDIERTVADSRAIMAAAGRTVTGGFEVATDAGIVRYPDRYRDARGADIWARVWGIMGRLTGGGYPGQIIPGPPGQTVPGPPGQTVPGPPG